MKIIIFLLAVICIAGLPLRMQNINLNGYVSDDAWWHFRHIKEVVESGRRLDPDIHEFTTLSRPMTYPPLFHYLVAYLYKIFGAGSSLIKFTHYYNILEGILYILFIYGISWIFSRDRLFSLVGALASAVSYGIIIRARAGELMPFATADLLAFAGILFLLLLLKNPLNNRRNIFLCVLAGAGFGLSMLAWNGSVLIYVPLVFFAFLALALSNPKFTKKAIGLFILTFCLLLVISLPWYLPLILKYGLNPHPKEMSWFMQGFTVLHQVKPLGFYILTCGISIFFVPILFFSSLFKRDSLNIFVCFWIVLGLIATYTGWRGYVAVMPVISAVAISIGSSRLVYYFFKKEPKYIPLVFLIIFLFTGIIGYYISDVRLAPLDPENINEVRTNAKSIKMLEFLKEKYPDAIAMDHISWVSEDEAAGSLRMVSGQYLEYLPSGSSEALKDVSRLYLADEESAYKICQKYGTQLIIVRKQLLQLPQLSLLFAPSELKSSEFMKITRKPKDPSQITINFRPKGIQTMLFRMLNRQKLNRFELIYAAEESGPLPFLSVYKVLY